MPGRNLRREAAEIFSRYGALDMRMRNYNKELKMKIMDKRGKALLVCSLLAALTIHTGTAYGATGIDVEKTDCQLTFTLDAEELPSKEQAILQETVAGYQSYYQELSEALNEQAIEAKIYRVAEVDVSGQYALLPNYAGAEALSGITRASAQTTANEWAMWAEEASVIARAQTPQQTVLIEKDADGKVHGYAKDLPTGLYLVDVTPVETTGYQYQFIPYLISLPNHYGDDGGSDEWIYGDGDTPVLVALKPEREDRYGDLVIEKDLTSYHETLGGASFVYEIRAVKEDALVYSDVVALNFDAPGQKSLTVTGIPAAAEVTVTEIYTGAGYQAVGAASQTRQTEADRAVQVSFENEYDGSLRGGGPAVVNHFTYEKDIEGSENLTWERQ